ncbi:hypothetical protein GN956_G17729 [Arapaima gigas]
MHDNIHTRLHVVTKLPVRLVETCPAREEKSRLPRGNGQRTPAFHRPSQPQELTPSVCVVSSQPRSSFSNKGKLKKCGRKAVISAPTHRCPCALR